MTPNKTPDPDGDDLGVLDETPSSDTTGIGLPGPTAQVSVTLPTTEDDEIADDEVVDGEIESELIIDTSAVADDVLLARISQDAPEIVIELPPDSLPAGAAADTDGVLTADDAQPDADGDDVVVAEIVTDAVSVVAEAGAAADEAAPVRSDASTDADTAGAEAAAVASADVAGTTEGDTGVLADIESAVAAAKAELRQAMTPVPSSPAPSGTVAAPHEPNATRAADRVPTAEAEDVTGPLPGERPRDAAGAVTDRAVSSDPASVAPRSVVDAPLVSKRLDDLGAASRETAELLTADRLLDPSRVSKPEPEGLWNHLLYSISGGRINIGDSKKARHRKQLTARISAPISGNARFVPVLSRKGGVGKTTVTALLGMALADARDDRVIAVDANPDRGTLADRVAGAPAKSVRDLVRAQSEIRGFHDVSALVARDRTRLDVLASDSDPRVAEAFGDAGYRDVAAVAAQYYSLVLTDSGTGIVHAVMGATLDLADQIVVVSGLSVDEARLASETLTWLETNGYADLAQNAIVVLNQSTPGAPLVRLGELEAHFSTRVRQVLRIPYDPQIAGGGTIDFGALQPATREAAREIAAQLVEGLRMRAA